MAAGLRCRCHALSVHQKRLQWRKSCENLMTLNLALALAFVLSLLYAAMLAATDFGSWLRQELTWVTVVLGVGMTLGCIALVDRDAAAMAALFFAVAGTPIVGESLYRMWRTHRETQHKQLEPKNGE